MLATLVDEPFHREGWVFEEKYDGYRVIACKRNRQAAGHRVAVVGRLRRGLGELAHSSLGRRDVGIAETQVDDVMAGPPGLDLEVVDDREDVWRQVLDAPELHHDDATATSLR